MRKFLLSFLLLVTGCAYSQKYVLIDKKMSQPLSYTNKVTLEHSYKGFFAVESAMIHQFIAAVEKIAAQLSGKAPRPDAFNFNVGKTNFMGQKVHLAKEETMNVVLTTDCDGTKIMMHLSEAKMSNANNAFFVNTWLKYIKGALK